ncbi:hypothetical protein NE237_024197 [Protea cynaroides]|uniref:Uncharacterized protein n=1 Tax=Protea cynaroides TaxID=273540 RepID=A0A9Q0HDH5_9MAGN|nr:hypothetical protein NE237_024197 [Protea cynaroides]
MWVLHLINDLQFSPPVSQSVPQSRLHTPGTSSRSLYSLVEVPTDTGRRVGLWTVEVVVWIMLNFYSLCFDFRVLRVTMIDTKKKKKKGSIREEDVSLILQRYTATTIIALIQEVAQFADVKIDWNSLVKKTSTGISNAREYQMLWRHLAYSHTLLDKLEDGAEPLDDDSDLEYEFEAFPPVSSETAMEAAACAKVLTAPGLPSDSGLLSQSTVEAPLTINIPNGANITVPVFVQKQPLPTVTTAEGLDGNGSASISMPARRKRKLWTAEEDMELIAAVQKCGEGNWANILKGDFKGDRTASQLSQRWAIIRKRQANSNPGAVSNSGSQLSEAQLAARRAVSLALSMPMKDSLSTACSVAAMNWNPPSSSSVLHASAEASPASNAPMEASTKSAVGSSSSQAQQSQQPPQQIAGSIQTGATNSTPRSRVTLKKTTPPVKPALGPNPMIQAAAVAAGARIATPSTAASLLKAAQSKNAVHIRPGGNSLIKTSVAGSTKPLSTSHAGPRPNVHYIRTTTSSSQPANQAGVSSTAPLLGSSQQATSNSVRPTIPTGQLPPANAAPSSNLVAHQTMSTSSVGITSSVTAECKSGDAAHNMGAGPLSEEDVKPCGERALDSSNVTTECLQYEASALPNSDAVGENQTAVVENLRNSQNLDADVDDQVAIVNKQTDESQTAGERLTSSPVRERSENRFVVSATSEDEIMEEQMDVSIIVTGGSDAEHTVIGAKFEGDDPTMEKPKGKLGESDVK